MSELGIDRIANINLPEGTVTFLFTDIEGSTKLLEQLGDQYATLLSDQRRILRESFSKWHGQEVDTQGDAFFVAFPRATQAVSSAVEIQRALAHHDWPGGVEVRLRLGLHTGEPLRAEGGYVGMDVHRAARIAHIGHGGQVLLSETSTALVLDELPKGVELLDLGRHLLKDIRRPERIRQLVIEGLPSEFPPLTSLEHLPPAELREPRQVGGCPYRGLAAFRENDALFFYGRETFTERLLEAVRTQPIVAVIVGSSGSGKSSAVFAGLLPRLRGEKGWDIAVFRPGSQPFFALGGVLLSLLEPDLSEVEQLVETTKLSEPISTGELSLIQVVERILANSQDTRQVMLVIDQFEELYTLCPDVETQRRFIDTLLAAVQSASAQRLSPLVLLLTMRADFMGQALTHRPFADALQEASLIMGPMNREELRAAIEKPAEMQGAAFEPGLVERILDDVGQEPGNLPLLEFALTLLWERQHDGWLTHEDYEALGCVQGALASYADEIYAGLDENERQAATRIFVQLVMPGEGTQDTRRVATCDELGENNWALIQHLADKRLVVTGRDAASGDETVEVLHEALIQRWRKLREWMSADRAFRTWQERLRNSLRVWEASNRDQGALLRGAPLVEAEDWLQKRSDDLTDIEKKYIEASIAYRRETQARRERRRRRIITGLAVGMIIALLLSILAGLQWRRAEDSGVLALNQKATAQAASTLAIAQQGTAQAASTLAIQRADALATSRAITEEEARLARLREMARASLDHLDTDPQLGLLLALYAIDQSDLDNRALLSQVEGALHRAVQSAGTRLQLTIDTPGYDIRYATFNANGDHLVTWGFDPGGEEVTKVYDAISGDLLARLPGRYAAQTSWPEDSRLVTLNQVPSTNVELTYWDTFDGEVLKTKLYTFPDVDFRIYEYWANTFDPSESRLALVSRTSEDRIGANAASATGSLIVWDLSTDQTMLNTKVELDQGLKTYSMLAFKYDSTHVIVGSWDKFLTWDNTNGEMMPPHNINALIKAIGISPDGKLLASGERNIVKLWDLETSQLLLTLPHIGNVLGIKFNPDGDLLATDCTNDICIWDISSIDTEGVGILLYRLSGHKGQIMGFDFSPSGDKLVTGSLDATIKIWDLTPGRGVEGLTFVSESKQPDINRSSIALSPDGTQLAVANGSEVPIVWDTTNGGKLFILSGHQAPVEHIAYTPDGALIATGGRDGTVKLWDSDTGELLLSLEDFSEGCCQLTFSPDGTSLAVGKSAAFSTVHVYDLVSLLDKTQGSSSSSSSEERFTVYAHEGPLSGLAYHPDGTNLTTSGEDGQVELWDIKKGVNIPSIIPPGDVYTSIEYNKDGSLLAIGEQAGTVKLWDVMGEKSLVTLTGHTDAVNAIAFDPTSHRVATASADGTTRIWDIEAGLELFTLYGHEGSVTDLTFSPDGKYLYTAGADGIVRTYIMDLNELIALGRERLTRKFTEQECRQYLHLEQCPSQQ